MSFRLICSVMFLMLSAPLALGTPFFFNNGLPDGRLAAATRPEAGSFSEIETADDFIITNRTQLTRATFTGWLTGSAALSSLGDITVELYRTFPSDSDSTRSIHVPTRANSPSAVALDARSSSASTLVYTVAVINEAFTAQNSVLNGIHPSPNQTSGGDGPVTDVKSSSRSPS